MSWKSRRYRLLRVSAILLFAGACYGGAASLVLAVGYWSFLGWLGPLTWSLTLVISSAAGILAGLIWWKASRMLTVVENATESQRSPLFEQSIPVAKPAPIGAARRKTDAAFLAPAAPVDAGFAPPVTAFRGRMSGPCRTLCRLGTAAMVVSICSAGAALIELVVSLARSGGYPGPLFHVGRVARSLGVAFQSFVFGLFIFAFTRLVARLGQAAESGPAVDVARRIE